MVKRILLIEDDPFLSSLLKNRFVKEGYNVEFAENGKQGIEFAQKYEPDAILLDVVLPDIDGYEVCKKIRSHPVTRNTKIVICTNKLGAVDGIEAKKSGADELVAKLSEPSLLIETIQSLIGKNDKA